jgi:hypothetical protein
MNTKSWKIPKGQSGPYIEYNVQKTKKKTVHRKGKSRMNSGDPEG